MITKCQTVMKSIALSHHHWQDECGVSTRLVPLRGGGCSPQGERVIGTEPRGRWDTISLLATRTVEGMRTSVVVSGAVDWLTSYQFIEMMLPPTPVTG